MPIDFPDTPSVNDEFTSADGRAWYWTGSVWNVVTSSYLLQTIQDEVEDNQILSIMGAI